MATQADDSAPTASVLTPQLVANAFVQKYYIVLSESPELVRAFYHEASVISRPESDGSMSSVSTDNGIHQMIPIDYENCLVEILTVDAQDSLDGGVIVLVTGFFNSRKFTQLFFLAPQETGKYFVLNDVFRYVDEEVDVKIIDADDAAPTAPVTPDSEPTPVSNHTVLTHLGSTLIDDNANQAEESNHLLENGKIPTIEGEVVADPPVSAAAASDVQEDIPKKSYASVANELNFTKLPFQQRVSSAKPVQQVRTADVPYEASPRPPNKHAVEKNNNHSAKGYSIFVANLPMDATVEHLIQTFEKFGPIKPNGVQVRSYKQNKNCFGFVEFESATSMQRALEIRSILIGNRTCNIEEKKGVAANNGDGRYPLRKGDFRSDCFRSHGNFNGGLGYGRNNFENHGGFSGQGRGATGHNGERNQSVRQNGGGRAARQAQAAQARRN